MKDEKTRKEVRNEGNQEGRQECIRGRNFRGKGEHAAEKKKDGRNKGEEERETGVGGGGREEEKGGLLIQVPRKVTCPCKFIMRRATG